MDSLGEDCHGYDGVVEFCECVVDFMGDVEEGGEGESLELLGSEFTCPGVEDLEHLAISGVQ